MCWVPRALRELAILVKLQYSWNTFNCFYYPTVIILLFRFFGSSQVSPNDWKPWKFIWILIVKYFSGHSRTKGWKTVHFCIQKYCSLFKTVSNFPFFEPETWTWLFIILDFLRRVAFCVTQIHRSVRQFKIHSFLKTLCVCFNLWKKSTRRRYFTTKKKKIMNEMTSMACKCSLTMEVLSLKIADNRNCVTIVITVAIKRDNTNNWENQF